MMYVQIYVVMFVTLTKQNQDSMCHLLSKFVSIFKTVSCSNKNNNLHIRYSVLLETPAEI